MKKILLALGLLAAVAAVAGAQTAGTNTVERGGYYFNATTGARVNADGSAYTEDGSRDRDQYYYATIVAATNIDGTSMNANARQDSSGVIDMRGMRNVGLFFRVKPAVSAWTPDSLADSSLVYLAVQIRAHANGGTDTTNVAAIMSLEDTRLYSGPTQMADSAGKLVTLTPTDGTWRAFGHVKRPGPQIGYAPGTYYLPGSQEKVLVFDVSRMRYIGGYPDLLWLPLEYFTGSNTFPRYLSVRVRVLKTPAPASVRVDMEAYR